MSNSFSFRPNNHLSSPLPPILTSPLPSLPSCVFDYNLPARRRCYFIFFFQKGIKNTNVQLQNNYEVLFRKLNRKSTFIQNSRMEQGSNPPPSPPPSCASDLLFSLYLGININCPICRTFFSYYNIFLASHTHFYRVLSKDKSIYIPA